MKSVSTERLQGRIFAGVLILFLLLAGVVSAYSESYSSVNKGGIGPATGASKTTTLSLAVPGNICNWCHYGKLFIDKPSVTIQYGVEVIDAATGAVIPPNGAVQVGKPVILKFKPHVSTDIYWFASGHFQSSPYGDWVTSQSLAPSGPDKVPAEIGGIMSSLCVEKNLVAVGNKKGRGVYGSLSVNNPTKHVEGMSAYNCTPSGNDALECVFTSEGPVNPAFVFDATHARFFTSKQDPDEGSVCGPVTNRTYAATARLGAGSGKPPYVLSVPTASINYPLTVIEAVGTPPSDPVVNAGGSCVVGQPFSISMTSTDAENDNIRYGVDWDNSGAPDQWVPPTGYVPSGTTQTATRTYGSAGTKTVRVLAEDTNAMSSGYTSITFTCTDTEDDSDDEGEGILIIDGDGSGSGSGDGSGSGSDVVDLSLRAIPSLVRTSDTTQVHWSSTNVTSCTVSGTNGDVWSGLESPVGGETTAPIVSQVIFTLTCRDDSGGSHSVQASVNVLPTWVEQ